MKIKSTINLPNGIDLIIFEAVGQGSIISSERNVDIRPLFENRFLVVVEIENRKIFPKVKEKFRKFKSISDIYTLYSDVTFEPVKVEAELYQELKMCDKSLEECNTELMEYISMYNQGIDLKKELKKTYKI